MTHRVLGVIIAAAVVAIGSLEASTVSTISGVTTGLRVRGGCFHRRATISGTGLADPRIGTLGDDTMKMRAGSDSANGLPGRDRICGGKGDDLLIGGDGYDRINGGPGEDHCEGEVEKKCEG